MNEARQPEVLWGERGGSHPLAAFIDHLETYGPHVVESFVRKIAKVEVAVDLGAGSGRDLGIVKKIHPTARTVAVEAGAEYAAGMSGKFDDVKVLDIERSVFPFDDESVDLVIANQVLEHTKEVFWIFHEVTRIIRTGGYFIFGVPNIASLHNRFLLLFGSHPTQHKMCSAHVRPFSKRDTMKFVDACFPSGYSLEGFMGSQFYPFPKFIARPLAASFPTAAFSIFFMLKKVRPYNGEFVAYPARAKLETNFYTGGQGGGQYKI